MKKIKAIVLAVMLVVLAVVDSVLGLTNITVEASNILQITVDTVEGKQGDKGVQVAVSIQNPNKINIGALVFEVTWDKTALKATNAVEGKFVLSGEPAINIERMSEGFIGYADASAMGETAEGQIILITFDVLDEAKEGLNSIHAKVLSAASAVPEGDNLAPEITDIIEIGGGINIVCVHANVKDSDYKVTKEPTVTEEGLEEATCPDCATKLTHLIKKIEYGDVNADGSINIQDGVILKKHLAGIKGLKINLTASDVKADGDINIQDAVILVKHLAGMSVTLGK